MKRAFLLEDDEVRVEWFLRNIPFLEWTVAMSFREAQVKYNGPYDFCFLDHDLGGRQYVDGSDAETGSNFIRHYADKLGSASVLIHSHNPVGAQYMEDLLVQAGVEVCVMPFGVIVTNWNRGILAIDGQYKFDKPLT